MNILDIFTDGSAINNTKNAPAGCAIHIPKYNFTVGKSLYGTNNIAELSSIKYALYLCLKNFEYFMPQIIHIYSDSTYSINTITGKFKAKANMDIINKCKEYISKLNEKHAEVQFIWIEAHTNKNDYQSKCNAIVDNIANSHASELNKSHEPITWHEC